MHVYYDPDREDEYLNTPRAHPWTTSDLDPAGRYYDLKGEPHLIRTVLEDFVPFAKWEAIQEFYNLIEFMNGPNGWLETNDCLFHGPSQDRSNKQIKKRLECKGRLVLFYRDLKQNTDEGEVRALGGVIESLLKKIDPNFLYGCWDFALWPHEFTALPGNQPDRIGCCVAWRFWSWGDSESETMQNLERTITNFRKALQSAQSNLVVAARTL